jgi:hypothetical protein
MWKALVDFRSRADTCGRACTKRAGLKPCTAGSNPAPGTTLVASKSALTGADSLCSRAADSYRDALPPCSRIRARLRRQAEAGEHTVLCPRGAAQAAGYRPCKRCRPETSADTPSWLAASETISRALRLIGQGPLDEDLGVASIHARSQAISRKTYPRAARRRNASFTSALCLGSV